MFSERGVKEAFYVKLKEISLNKGGGHIHQFSVTYNTVLKSLPRIFSHRQHLGSCDTNGSHDGWGCDNPTVGWADL